MADPISPKRSIVAITGSTGYLGREVVRQLLGEGVQVLALQRDAASIDRWSLLCRDIAVVIHLAAPTSAVDEAAIADALATTRRLVDALPDRPLSFVFAGSMAVFKPSTDGRDIDERSAVFEGDELADQDAYTRMKGAQEAQVRAACLARGDRLSILRPSNVWDDERWQQSCIGPKAGPFWLVVDPGRPLRLNHRVNCARAFVEAALASVGTSDAFNIDDSASISAWRYATQVAGWRRRGYLPIPIARWLFDATTACASTALRLVAPGRRVPGLLIAARRAARFGRYGVDTRRARERLKWTPDLGPYGIVAEAS